jgi:4-hydroxybenzoate polyprenyltransferase
MDEQIKKIIEDDYDDSRQEGLMSMARDFYNKKMLNMVVLVWSLGIIFMAGAVYSGIEFFRTDEIRYQIMYAVIFMTCLQWVGSLKIFAWQVIHRNNIKREIKRLELTIAELNQTVKDK